MDLNRVIIPIDLASLLHFPLMCGFQESWLSIKTTRNLVDSTWTIGSLFIVIRRSLTQQVLFLLQKNLKTTLLIINRN